MTDSPLDGRLACSAGLVAEVAALLELPCDLDWADLGGSRTTNLRVQGTDRSPVVVRVHRGYTSHERLTAEQRARTVLAEAGIPTVAPLADAEGKTVHRMASGRLVEVEPFVPSADTMNTADLLRRGFALLARLHDVLRVTPLPDAARSVRYANHLESREALAATRSGANRVRQWQDPSLTRFADRVVDHVEAVTAVERADGYGEQRQVVHGDFWDNNVLFAGNQVTAVLDFGFMAERTRIDDLALPIWFFLLEPGHQVPAGNDRNLVRDLLNAYDAATTQPLSPAERRSLPLAIARQPAWSVGRWVLELPTVDAVSHAREAAAELKVAEAIMSDLHLWHQALC